MEYSYNFMPEFGTIRSAVMQDMQALLELEILVESTAEPELWARNEATFLESFHIRVSEAIQNETFFICEVRGQIVAMAWILFEDGFPPELIRLRVHPTHRRKYHATHLIQHIESYLRNTQYDTLGIWVFENNTSAQLLYTKMGYTPTGRVEAWDLPIKEAYYVKNITHTPIDGSSPVVCVSTLIQRIRDIVPKKLPRIEFA